MINNLTNNELMEVSGGAIHLGAIIGIALGAAAFIAGVLDGQIKLK